jgi:hypothetical protein
MVDIFQQITANFKNDMDKLLTHKPPFEVTYQLDGKVMSLIFKSKKEMALSMMRIAEFYESPHSNIKGKYFTHEDILDTYSSEDGDFEYMNYYEGFNVPKVNTEGFRYFFHEKLTKREEYILLLLRNSDVKYLIATMEGDVDTLDHELAHARFALDPEYNQQIQKVIYSIPKDVYALLQFDLLQNYDMDVIDDEIQAYLQTAPMEELEETFPSFNWHELEQLRQLFG